MSIATGSTLSGVGSVYLSSPIGLAFFPSTGARELSESYVPNEEAFRRRRLDPRYRASFPPVGAVHNVSGDAHAVRTAAPLTKQIFDTFSGVITGEHVIHTLEGQVVSGGFLYKAAVSGVSPTTSNRSFAEITFRHSFGGLRQLVSPSGGKEGRKLEVGLDGSTLPADTFGTGAPGSSSTFAVLDFKFTPPVVAAVNPAFAVAAPVTNPSGLLNPLAVATGAQATAAQSVINALGAQSTAALAIVAIIIVGTAALALVLFAFAATYKYARALHFASTHLPALRDLVKGTQSAAIAGGEAAALTVREAEPLVAVAAPAATTAAAPNPSLALSLKGIASMDSPDDLQATFAASSPMPVGMGLDSAAGSPNPANDFTLVGVIPGRQPSSGSTRHSEVPWQHQAETGVYAPPWVDGSGK